MGENDLSCSKGIVSASNQPDRSQGSYEKTEKQSDIGLAYKDQGYHEMEFTSSNENDLHDRKNQCQKNPGHVEFIPVKSFAIDHLSEYWRESLVFKLISTMISLTVRLAVRYTSKDRPPDYPLYNRRGKCGLTAFGSGMVCNVYKKFTEDIGLCPCDECTHARQQGTCPCETCTQFPHKAEKHWAEFGVETAKHVVFDTSEARNTKCDLFFDSDEDRHHCPRLEGVEVYHSNSDGDYCLMRCITHDEHVSNQLVELIDRYNNLRNQLQELDRRSRCVDKKMTAVVISHPHGLSKHVTVGELVVGHDAVPRNWMYTAETCPGSSGGTVCILGEWDENLGLTGPYNATHSGCQQKGQNESTTWWS